MLNDPLWPLVIIFGSYRGTGREKLTSLSRHLRRKGIRAHICEEYANFHCPRKEGESQDAYNTRASFYCTEKCDMAIFVLFRGVTIDVDADLESLDQAISSELTHLYDSKRKIPIQFIFDSATRAKFTSSVFRGLLQSPLLQDYVHQKVIEAGTEEEAMKDIKSGALGFCLSEYADYADRAFMGLTKLLSIFDL